MKKLHVAVAMLICGSASAAIIPSLSLVAPAGTTPESILAGSTGNTYFYSLALAADTKLDTSRPFEQALVIYDFAGYIPDTIGSVSGNWIASVQDPGPVIDPEITVEAGDAAGLVNLVFRYIGPVILGPQSGFDVVYADSVFNQAILDRYQGQGTKVVPPPDIANENNTATGTDGNVGVPAAIPEPGSMALIGSGLLFVALRFRSRP